MFVFCQEKVSKNMKFNEFFSEKSIISELSQKTFNKLPKNLSDLLTNKKLPFENIFNGKLRISENFKSRSEYGEQIKDLLGDKFEIDFEKWVGHKLTDSEKKNPTRIGKLLQKKKQEIEKNLKQIDDYQKNGVNSSSLPSVSLFMNYGLLQQNLRNIDELLKISDLQKAHSSTSKSQYSIIYSRVPVDVARMSDFSWRSCHSEGGDYFNCALADAMLNAGIAYLVDSQQLISAAGGNEKIDDFLQKDEIFSDSGRNIQGIEPLARIRIRCVLDEQGNQLAVPSLKIYKSSKISGIETEFKELVKEWAKRQDSKQFNWTDTLTLKGGSYQDLMYDIKTMIYEIWGANISYDSAVDEDEFEDEESEDQDHVEEQFWDSIREDINTDKIFKDVLGESYEDLFSVDLDLYNGRLYLEYNVSDEFFKYLKDKRSTMDGTEERVYKIRNQSYAVDTIYRVLGPRKDVRMEPSQSFELWRYDYDVETSYFDYTQFKNDVKEHLQKLLESFIGEFLPDDILQLRYYLNKAVAKYYGVPYQEVSEEEIEYLTSWTNAEDFYEGILPNFPYNFEPINYSYQLKIPDQVKDYFLENECIFDNFIEKSDKLHALYFGCIIRVPQPKSGKPIDGYTVNVYDSSQTNFFKVVVDLSTRTPKINFRLSIRENDLEEIIDNNLTKEYHDLMKYLYDELYEEIQDIKYFPDLQDFLEKRTKRDNLKDQGQMELDLSSINRIMNNFDSYIYKLWTEDLANMGSGGLTNRTSGSSSSPSKGGFGMNTSSSAPKTNQSRPAQKTGTNSINVSEQDMDNILLNPNTNFDEILKDPNNQQPLFSHITNSLMNPSYKNKDKLQSLLQQNKNLAASYTNFVNSTKQ